MERDTKRTKTHGFDSDDEARNYMQRMRGDPSIYDATRPDLTRSIWVYMLSNNPLLSIHDIDRMCRVNRAFAGICASGDVWNTILRRQVNNDETYRDIVRRVPTYSGRQAMMRLLAWRLVTYNQTAYRVTWTLRKPEPDTPNNIYLFFVQKDDLTTLQMHVVKPPNRRLMFEDTSIMDEQRKARWDEWSAYIQNHFGNTLKNTEVSVMYSVFKFNALLSISELTQIVYHAFESGYRTTPDDTTDYTVGDALIEGKRGGGKKGRRRRGRGAHKMSRKKAREILHHGKVHGHRLTEKQRRYFGWLASRGEMLGLGLYDVIPIGAMADETLRVAVVRLLNTRTQQDTRRAIAMLQERYLSDEPPLEVEFDACKDKEPAYYYMPYKTAEANGHRIRLCDDARKQSFSHDYPRSKTVQHDPRNVQHYAVIVLHEFGHVLDKTDHLDDIVPGLPPQDQKEERADLFAQWFLGGASIESILETSSSL